MKWLKKRAAIELEELGWWLLAIAVLVISLIGYMILSGKGQEIIAYIKRILWFKM